VAFVALAACGSGGDDGGTPPEDYYLMISSSPSAISMPQGGSAELSVTVTRGGGYPGAISLEVVGLPSYMTGSFSPASLTGSATHSTLTIAADGSVLPGLYPFVIRASGSGVDDAMTEPINCSVTERPGFSLSLTNPTLSVTQGETGSVTVLVQRTGGWLGPVTLSASGMPAGVEAGFNPNPATAAQSTLTINVPAATATGSYPLTVKGTGTGMPDRTVSLTLEVKDATASGYTLTADPELILVDQGSTATSLITVHRTGGFAGTVQFFPEGMPPGITPSFNPHSTTGNTTTLTVAAGPGYQPGDHPLTVRGEATGLPARRINLTVRVVEVAGFALSASPSAVTISPGTPDQVVGVTIQRTGGFTGEVSLAVSGLPASVTATVDPPATAGNSANVTLAAVSGAPAGSYTATITGTANGVPARTTQVAVTVVQSGTSIVWRFCGDNPAPVFFAYQDGSSPFTAVAAAGDGTFTMTMASTRGAVVLVQPLAGYTTQLRYASTGELQSMAAAQCTGPLVTKTVHGTVANVPADRYYAVALGGALTIGTPPAPTSFTLENVQGGNRDLVAGRASLVADVAIPDRFIIRRDLNPADGSTLPVLDFASSEGFAPVASTLAITGLPAATNYEINFGFLTANGTVGVIGTVEGSAAQVPWHGIPVAQLRNGDLHSIIAETDVPGRRQELTLYSREVEPRSITFPAELAPPAVSLYATTPVYRLRAAGNFGSTGTAYGGIAAVTFAQADRTWIVSQTRGWTGMSSNYDLRTAILTGLPGWNEALYGVKPGSLVTWNVLCSGAGGIAPMDGATLHRMEFTGVLTP
jgi:uncharacterized membrane protein